MLLMLSLVYPREVIDACSDLVSVVVVWLTQIQIAYIDVLVVVYRVTSHLHGLSRVVMAKIPRATASCDLLLKYGWIIQWLW